jgi:hypothetical protein
MNFECEQVNDGDGEWEQVKGKAECLHPFQKKNEIKLIHTHINIE